MKRIGLTSIAICSAMTVSVAAQTPDPNPAMNNPDRFSWQLFVQVNAPGGAPGRNDVVFETWASNEDTFKQSPSFPPATAPSPKILNVAALDRLAPREPGVVPHVTADGTEEVRRNRVAFDFITRSDNLFHTRAGLARAFAAGRVISFPTDSIEVKANWKPSTGIDPARYHVNSVPNGPAFALISMHIISKAVPNWTWATFEHQDNPGRCDVIGCRDDFGATIKFVPPNLAAPNQKYPPCTKTPALQKMLADAGLAALFENYCLKGSQADFTTATGIPTRLGNSETERGFVDTSSCLTCHARASVTQTGALAQGGGFLTGPDRTPAVCPTPAPNRCSPNGTPKASWFWDNPGAANPQLKALQTDFVFSIPIYAIGP